MNALTMSATRLYIPPRTKLETVWRTKSGWLCYTAIVDRGAPFTDCIGTALLLNHDGSACRVTLNPDGTERMMQVMPEYGE